MAKRGLARPVLPARDELSDSLEPPEPPPRAYLLKASLLQGDEPLTRSPPLGAKLESSAGQVSK